MRGKGACRVFLQVYPVYNKGGRVGGSGAAAAFRSEFWWSEESDAPCALVVELTTQRAPDSSMHYSVDNLVSFSCFCSWVHINLYNHSCILFRRSS